MDLLDSFPETKNVSQHVLVIADGYTKRICAVPIAKSTASKVAEIFIDSLIIPYGITQYILTDNEPKYVPKFFVDMCALLGVKN